MMEELEDQNTPMVATIGRLQTKVDALFLLAMASKDADHSNSRARGPGGRGGERQGARQDGRDQRRFAFRWE